MFSTIDASQSLRDGEVTSQAKSISIGEALLFSLAFVAFFPYLKSSSLGSDVQPHYFALFPAALFVFNHRLKELLAGCLYLALLLASAVLLKMSPLEMVAITTLYITVFLVSGADERQKIVLCWAIRIAMVIYLVGIMVETVGGSGVLDQVVSNRRASGQRGCCSFASEPSFLGFTGLAAFIVLFKHGNRNWILDSVIPCLVMFGSGSIAAIIPGVIVIAAANLRSVKSLFATVVLISTLFILAFVAFPESRFVSLIKNVYRSPVSALEVSSGANRFFRGVAPSYYGLKSGFRPHSTEELDEVFREFKFLRDDVRITRISNLAGQLFFVFGVLSLPLVALYGFLLRKIPPREIVLAIIAIGVFAFSLVSTSTPYLHWLLSALLWRTPTRPNSNAEPYFE